MDPLSIIASSVSLLSFGITICDGLVVYCHTYKSRERDLNALGDHARRLQALLQAIEKRFQDGLIADASFRAMLIDCHGACEHCVSNVQTPNARFLQSPAAPGSSKRERSKAALQALKYPFEADRFEKLRQQLNDFHLPLSGLLLVMNYDLTAELQRKVDSHSTALSSAMSSQGSQLALQLASMGPSITHALDEGLSKLEVSIQKQFSGLEKQWTDFRRGEDTRHILSGMDMAQKPAIQPNNKSSPLLDPLCSCPSSHPQLHERTCFRWRQNRKVHVIAGKLRVFSSLVRFRLELQRAPGVFAKDLKVCANLTIRATVDWTEAFNVVHRMGTISGTRVKEFQKSSQWCLMELRRLFDEGKAWPTDTTTHGYSLLHCASFACERNLNDDSAAIYLQFLKGLIDLGVPLNDIECQGHNTPLSCIMWQSNFWSISFSRTSGVPRRMAPRESDQFYDRIISQLMEVGAEVPGIEEAHTFGDMGPYLLPMLYRGTISPDNGFGYGALSCALIQQSELDVRRLLSRSQSHILEKSRRMESPLHVATYWPRGVELLLQLGGEAVGGILNTPNAFNESPLDYALQLGQLSSVRPLVDAGTNIDLEGTFIIECANIENWNATQFDEIITFLCQTLAERRKRMLCLALEWLPEHETCRLGLKNEDMLQSTAFEVSELFRQQRHHLYPLFENVRPGSIYHSGCLSRTLAQALLGVGFSSTNTTFHGFTPLMAVDLKYLTSRRGLSSTVDLVTWFLDQGASLQSSIPVSALRGFQSQPSTTFSGFKTVHRIAYVYGDGPNFSAFSAADHSRIDHMRGIVSDTSTDPCICYCSLKGCTPATLFIRGLFRFAYLKGSQIQTPRDPTQLRELKRHMKLMSTLLSDNQTPDIVTDIIRVITFHRLEMKHTCCSYISQESRKDVTPDILAGRYKIVDIMEPEEVAEIQEEDQHQALHLEALVAEFITKYKEENTSFYDFFFEYWWQRMIEVEAEREHICADDLREIRRTGVVLDGE
ncbi:uncharacterized protein E0L32_006795 [Thyridium curvatum]|uniref:Uncharacterized protein n=1 Tax=Thyridium curvatum TaxID=1093900 RepID=A0A507APY5_9PEZI|nr:uncharacterized protein E0L32_006795 [Thyridium curvatum]TPX12915.1 hypothetical protein E0L32_006795 [Thyridium curvatum]